MAGLLSFFGAPEADAALQRGIFNFVDAFPDNRERRLREEALKRQHSLQDEELAYTRSQREVEAQAAAQAARDQDIIRRGLLSTEVESPMQGGLMGPGAPMPKPSAVDLQTYLAQGGSVGGLPTVMGLNSAFAPPKPEYRVVDGALVKIDGGDVSEAYRAPAKPEKVDPNKPFMLDANGNIVPNRAYQDYDLRARRAGATNVSVGTGQKDANWGTPPKDYVWARDSAGNVMTERDPASGAFRPIATPIGGSKDERAGTLEKQQAADKASRTFQTIDQMLRHPGLNTAIGMSGQIDPRNYMWGTQAQGARALIEQAQGQAFLQAFESLKGGGQITQVEGEKATAAIARLQRAQSDADFRAAAEELKQIAANAYQRATGRRINEGPTMQPMGDASLDDLLKKYGN